MLKKLFQKRLFCAVFAYLRRLPKTLVYLRTLRKASLQSQTMVHSITARLKSNRRLQRNIYQMQLAFEMFLSDPVYHEAMESSRRFALYTAISSGVISAQQWQKLWPSAKRGMWHDKRWNWAQKLIFFAARVNFTLTSFCFKVLTGRLKK